MQGCRAEVPLVTPDTPGNTTYRVVTYTADTQHAGTDADVYITLFGDRRDTGEQLLHNSTGKMMERGQVRLPLAVTLSLMHLHTCMLALQPSPVCRRQI